MEKEHCQPMDGMDKDEEPPVKPKLRSAKPKVKKVRKWCRLKSGLFGWKTVTVQEGLPKPSCKVENNTHTLKNYSDSASSTFFKKNFENQQQLSSKSGSTKSGCKDFQTTKLTIDERQHILCFTFHINNEINEYL